MITITDIPLLIPVLSHVLGPIWTPCVSRIPPTLDRSTHRTRMSSFRLQASHHVAGVETNCCQVGKAKKDTPN